MIKNNTRIIVRNIFYESVNGKNPDISHIPRLTLSHISEDVYRYGFVFPYYIYMAYLTYYTSTLGPRVLI